MALLFGVSIDWLFDWSRDSVNWDVRLIDWLIDWVWPWFKCGMFGLWEEKNSMHGIGQFNKITQGYFFVLKMQNRSDQVDELSGTRRLIDWLYDEFFFWLENFCPLFVLLLIVIFRFWNIDPFLSYVLVIKSSKRAAFVCLCEGRQLIDWFMYTRTIDQSINQSTWSINAYDISRRCTLLPGHFRSSNKRNGHKFDLDTEKPSAMPQQRVQNDPESIRLG